jgi:hypothetical protein
MVNKIMLFNIVKTIKEKINANIFIATNEKGEIKLHIIHKKSNHYNYILVLNGILNKYSSLEEIVNVIMNDYNTKKFQYMFSL